MMLDHLGYPQAHEHDAERAVRAGLEIVKAAPKLQTPAGVPLHVRVGIATGIVIVSDLLGSGDAQEREVVVPRPQMHAMRRCSRSGLTRSSGYRVLRKRLASSHP